MQSNTVEIRNQPVSFSNFSVEKKRCESDPFTIRDGRYFGNDGFGVPKDFPEFFRRFPDYLQRWVSKHVPASSSKEDKEDWTQDLLIHLSSLPLTSKHREAGKEDIVQTFDPVKHYGANEARFFNYINLCLANKFRTMRSKRMKNPLCRPGNLSLTADWDDMDRNQVNDEFCHEHSEQLRGRCQRQQKQQDTRQALAEFSEFVQREDSIVLPAMGAIASTATAAAAAELIGTTEADFCRVRSRLRQLGRCFRTGQRVPRRRRPYKTRLITPISFRVS